MQYRGKAYTPSHTTIQTKPLPLFGSYRGRRISFNAPQLETPIPEALTYRGIAYGIARSSE